MYTQLFFLHITVQHLYENLLYSVVLRTKRRCAHKKRMGLSVNIRFVQWYLSQSRNGPACAPRRRDNRKSA